MLIDLVLEGRAALVVGGGKESELKVLRLLDARANTTVLAPRFSSVLIGLSSKHKASVRLVRAEATSTTVRRLVDETAPRVVFISTGDPPLDEELAGTVRRAAKGGAIVCVVDEPRLNDFNMPAIARIGDIRVGISTGGKSPAMAGILRRKVEASIAREDVLQVRLQGQIRKAARKELPDPKSRKRLVYAVIRDERVAALLKRGDYPAAKKRAEEMLREVTEHG